MTSRVRTFLLDDQLCFAALSGDWNPIHVDPVAARRTMFGEPVVHGIHLVCWALDVAVGAQTESLRIESIRTKFRRPVLLDRVVELTQSPGMTEGETVMVGTQTGATVLELRATLRSTQETDATPTRATWPTRREPTHLRRDDVAIASGEEDVALDPELAKQMFPRLTSVAPLALAELLATTRVVGMRCPGLHSLYSGLDLQRRESGVLRQAYRVKTANMRYSLVGLGIEGPSLGGTLDTFYRPAPSEPLSMDVVGRSVQPSEFAGQRALVVGGSRGLGEAFAKVIAAGGGDVCITYHRGAMEAAGVVQAIRAGGGSASYLAFDATAEAAAPAEPLPWNPTHVYYFATPVIRVDPNAGFSASEFDHLARYYVGGLHALAQSLCARGARDLVVWAPSTTFLDNHERGAAAYCSAKAAMEELARHLPATLPVRVLTPRLPRTATDQTASLIPVKTAEPLALALVHVRAAHALNRRS